MGDKLFLIAGEVLELLDMAVDILSKYMEVLGLSDEQVDILAVALASVLDDRVILSAEGENLTQFMCHNIVVNADLSQLAKQILQSYPVVI